MLHIRMGVDGSYWIPRSDKETEAYLDAKYVRVKNELKWVDKIASPTKSYSDIYKGQVCYIVGKGPSLDLLKKTAFAAEGPVLAINESLHKIESLNLNNPVYGLQLDHNLKETCKPSKETTRLLVGPNCANLYQDKTYKVVMDPRSFGLIESCISAQFAIMIARLMGCVKLDMISFDGCVNNDFNYAKCIGYDSAVGGLKTRFASHKPLILVTAKNIPLTWVTPKENKVMRIDQAVG